MPPEPELQTEYTLVRFVDSELHVARFARFIDDSGCIRHGGLVIKIEFDWPVLLAHWRAMREAGWQTIEDTVAAGLLQADVTPSCDCPTYAANVIKHIDAGMPVEELNRKIKEENESIMKRHEYILWGRDE